MIFLAAAKAPPAASPVLPQIEPEAIQARMDRYATSFIDWIDNNRLELAIAILVGIAIFLVLSFAKKWAVRWSRQAPDRTSIRAIIARAAAKTSRFFRIMLAIELVSVAANTPPFLLRIFTFLFTIAVVWQVAVWARELIIGFIERRAGGGEPGEHETLATAMTLIRLLVSFAIFAIAIIVILDNLGVNVTGLVAGLGVGGIAIGLAAQGIFSDLFAAISIILDKPFRVGDIISFGTTTARVEKIGMKSTRLRQLSGEQVIITNNKLLDMEITKNSGMTHRRTRFQIGLIYQTAPEKARKLPALLEEIVARETGTEFIRAGFISFGDSALNFELLFDHESPEFMDMFAATHNIGLAIVEAFEKEGYEFAYPTQTTFTSAPDGTMIMPYPDQDRGIASPKRQKG